MLYFKVKVKIMASKKANKKTTRKFFGHTDGARGKDRTEKYDSITGKGNYVKYGYPLDIRSRVEKKNSIDKKDLKNIFDEIKFL